MKNTFIKFSCFFTLLALVACNPLKKTSTGDLSSRSAKFLLKKVNENAFDAEWVNSKAKVKVNFNGQKISANMLLRMQKNEVIFAQIKVLGLEVGRLKLTPDSVQVIDRFNKRYVKESVSELSNAFGVPVNFQTLQDVFFGRPFLWSEEAVKASSDKLNYAIENKEGRRRANHALDGTSFHLLSSEIVDQEADWKIDASFSDYGSGGIANFSYFRTIDFESTENLSLSIKLNKVEINQPQNLPFEIPSHYSKITL